MTDPELIARLCKWEGNPLIEDADSAAFGEAAARLGRLTAPAEGSPLSPDALADIRDAVRDHFHPPVAPPVLRLMVCDLLAALDHALARNEYLESAFARVVQDSHQYDVGREAGVAAALAVLEREADEEKRLGNAGTSLNFCTVAEQIRKECGPAELPPHSASLALLRKRTEALRRIVGLPSPALAPMQTGHAAEQIARDALGEDA